jgi:hypothetical protein
MWPGVQEAYDHKLVCFDDIFGQVCFDLNTVALKGLVGKSQSYNRMKKPRSDR